MNTQSPSATTNALRSTLSIEVREPALAQGEPSGSAPALDFISSDESLDRYGEVISASGWKLENYRRNPVFQNAHQYGDVIFTLGRALITEVRSLTSPNSHLPSPCLYQRIEFATDVNPMARIAYGLYKGKFLNAVSVGFIPLRWKDSDATAGALDVVAGVSPAVEGGILPPGPSSKSNPPPPTANTPPSSRASAPTLSRSTSPARPRRIYLEQELLEVSAVGIPANPNALVLGLKSGAIEKSDLRDLQDLLQQTLCSRRREEADSDEGEPVPIKILPQRRHTELLRLAQQVRDLLKK